MHIVPKDNTVKPLFEGWMLKKGNKKMQGYAKRWVMIEANGMFQYFKHSGR